MLNKITAVVIAVFVALCFDAALIRYGVSGLLGSRSDLAIPAAFALIVLLVVRNVAYYHFIKKGLKLYDAQQSKE